MPQIITTPVDDHMCEVAVCRILIACAERVIVAADASKFRQGPDRGLSAGRDRRADDRRPAARRAGASAEAADVELNVA
jgi:hypothetical protein